MEIQTIALMTRHSLDSDGTPIMPLYAISWTGEKDPPPQRKPRIRRNEPCACGSGKKYKKCCGAQ